MEIKEIVTEVIGSLYYYDRDGYSYLKRCPTGDLINTRTLPDFIECRLNLELYYVPELVDLVKYFDGHLLVVSGVTDLDESKRKYRQVQVDLVYPGDEYFTGDPDRPDLVPTEIFEQIKQVFGGTRLTFGCNIKNPEICLS